MQSNVSYISLLLGLLYILSSRLSFVYYVEGKTDNIWSKVNKLQKCRSDDDSPISTGGKLIIHGSVVEQIDDEWHFVHGSDAVDACVFIMDADSFLLGFGVKSRRWNLDRLPTVTYNEKIYPNYGTLVGLRCWDTGPYESQYDCKLQYFRVFERISNPEFEQDIQKGVPREGECLFHPWPDSDDMLWYDYKTIAGLTCVAKYSFFNGKFSLMRWTFNGIEIIPPTGPRVSLVTGADSENNSEDNIKKYEDKGFLNHEYTRKRLTTERWKKYRSEKKKIKENKKGKCKTGCVECEDKIDNLERPIMDDDFSFEGSDEKDNEKHILVKNKDSHETALENTMIENTISSEKKYQEPNAVTSYRINDDVDNTNVRQKETSWIPRFEIKSDIFSTTWSTFWDIATNVTGQILRQGSDSTTGATSALTTTQTTLSHSTGQTTTGTTSTKTTTSIYTVTTTSISTTTKSNKSKSNTAIVITVLILLAILALLVCLFINQIGFRKVVYGVKTKFNFHFFRQYNCELIPKRKSRR